MRGDHRAGTIAGMPLDEPQAWPRCGQVSTQVIRTFKLVVRYREKGLLWALALLPQRASMMSSPQVQWAEATGGGRLTLMWSLRSGWGPSVKRRMWTLCGCLQRMPLPTWVFLTPHKHIIHIVPKSPRRWGG